MMIREVREYLPNVAIINTSGTKTHVSLIETYIRLFCESF